MKKPNTPRQVTQNADNNITRRTFIQRTAAGSVATVIGMTTLVGVKSVMAAHGSNSITIGINTGNNAWNGSVLIGNANYARDGEAVAQMIKNALTGNPPDPRVTSANFSAPAYYTPQPNFTVTVTPQPNPPPGFTFTRDVMTGAVTGIDINLPANSQVTVTISW